MENIFADVLSSEGGFTVDSGGPTNMGITQSTLDAFTKKYNLPNMNVRNLTKEQVLAIYQQEYYKSPKVDALPKELQGVVFDYGVNAGPQKAIKSLQKAIGVKEDGLIGPKTLEAIEQHKVKKGSNDIVNKILDEQLEYKRGLAKNKPGKYGQYLKGWENRIERMRPKE